jgi:hypothetical protein
MKSHRQRRYYCFAVAAGVVMIGLDLAEKLLKHFWSYSVPMWYEFIAFVATGAWFIFFVLSDREDQSPSRPDENQK